MTAVTVRDRKRSEQEMQLLGAYAALTHQADGTFITLYEKRPRDARSPTTRARSSPPRSSSRAAAGRRGTLRKLIELLTDVDIHVLANPHEATRQPDPRRSRDRSAAWPGVSLSLVEPPRGHGVILLDGFSGKREGEHRPAARLAGSSSQTRPACASTMPLTIERPRPVPSELRLLVAHEAVEDAVSHLRRYARAVVDHSRDDRCRAPPGRRGSRSASPGRRVPVGVHQQVVEHLAEPVPVRDGLERSRLGVDAHD